MATTNYDIPTIEPTDRIDIPTDVNAALNAIDTSIKNVSDAKAPVNHASANTTYGIATNDMYGHVKISDSIDGASSGATLSAEAVKGYAQPLQTYRNAVVLIGDSYVAGNNPNAYMQAGFESNFPEFNFYNYGDSGSGYGMGGLASRDFSAQIDYAAANIQSDHSVSPADVGYVMIFGGRNDVGAQDSTTLPQYATLYPKVLATYKNAKTKFPNAIISAFFLYDWKLPNIAVLGMCDIMREAGANTGVFVPENTWSLGIGKMVSMYVGGTDIHPNQAGAETMAVQCMLAMLDKKHNMMLRQYWFYYSTGIKNNIYLELNESGLLVDMFGTISASPICDKAACPPFLKGAGSRTANWYAQGDTFVGGVRPYVVPICRGSSPYTPEGLLQFSHLGITTSGIVANTVASVYAVVPYAFTDNFSPLG